MGESVQVLLPNPPESWGRRAAVCTPREARGGYYLHTSFCEIKLNSALALSLFRELLKHKRVINILPSLQAYFDKRRYFPILMSTFAHDHKTKLIIQARRW